jgi:tyrosine-protein phosphatase SIW14
MMCTDRSRSIADPRYEFSRTRYPYATACSRWERKPLTPGRGELQNLAGARCRCAVAASEGGRHIRRFFGCIPQPSPYHLMRMRRFFPNLALCALLASPAMVAAQAPASISTSFAASSYGEKLNVAGLPRFGRINDSLYRGAQPYAEGLQQLKKLGITTIIDLRGEDPHKVDWERKQAEALGIRFIHLPVSGWSTPSDEQVAQFFSIFRSKANEKVFVHCRFGEDRTGVFIASYRIAFDHWSSDQALSEMLVFGFNRLWHPSMASYIRSLPQRLQSDPILKSSLGPQVTPPLELAR